MANSVLTAVALNLKCITGVDSNGRDITKKIGFNNIKVSAVDNNIYAVALDIEKLLDARVANFRKEESYIMEK